MTIPVAVEEMIGPIATPMEFLISPELRPQIKIFGLHSPLSLIKPSLKTSTQITTTIDLTTPSKLSPESRIPVGSTLTKIVRLLITIKPRISTTPSKSRIEILTFLHLNSPEVTLFAKIPSVLYRASVFFLAQLTSLANAACRHPSPPPLETVDQPCAQPSGRSGELQTQIALLPPPTL